MLILDVLARDVRERGDHPFILHEGQHVSYAEFDRLTNRFANAMRSFGVEKGDRITMAMGNSIDYLVATFGSLKAGAIYSPVNPDLGAKELRYIIGHAEPRVIITDSAHVAHLMDIVSAMSAAPQIACFTPTVGTIDLRQRMDASADTPCGVELVPSDPSTLLYTSGTTGNPKGVLFEHGKTGVGGRHFVDTLKVTPDDVVLGVTPLFHGNGWGAVITALHAGGTVAFPIAFKATDFWPLVHESKSTVLYTLGTILAILLSKEPSELEKKNPLRVILGLGSAPIRDKIIQRFGVEHVAECFGSTDAGVVTITPLGAAPRPGSAGPPVHGVQIRIVDEEGNEQPIGKPGEIAIHSPHRLTSYFRDPEQTALALRDEWFFTGDLGYLDADGWLFFVDRKRDVIRRGSENISSVLVEKTLCEHPNVAEAAVIGIPDPVLGQELKAVIVAKQPVTADELRDFAAKRLAKFQVPRLWEFRDSLPKTPTQRVEKYKLREEHGSTRPLMG